MMKKTYLIAAVVTLGILITPAFAQLGSQSFPSVNFNDENITDEKIVVAQTAFSDPGILPDHPFYFLKRTKENIQLFFTSDDTGKARLHLEFAKTRLAEANVLINKNKTADAERTINEYTDEINKLNVSRGIGQNVSSFVKETNETLEKSRIVLTQVLNKVPEKARPAIEKAINNSVEKRIRIEIRSEEKIKSEETREENKSREIENVETSKGQTGRTATSEATKSVEKTVEKSSETSKTVESVREVIKSRITENKLPVIEK